MQVDPIILWLAVAILFAIACILCRAYYSHRTCLNGGCGHRVHGNDELCAVCRLPL
jgi:hypothetical protein